MLAKYHAGAQPHFPDVDFNEDPHPPMRRTPLWCKFAFSRRRRQRGFASFGAQNTTLVQIRIFQTSTSMRIRTLQSQNTIPVQIRIFQRSTSMRIRTLRCAAQHSGAQSHFLNVDLNEDPHPPMRRTPLWCKFAFSRRRPQRGFAPFDAQNTTLVRKPVF